MVRVQDQNVYLTSLFFVGQVDAIVERVVIHFCVVVDTLVFDMAVVVGKSVVDIVIVAEMVVDMAREQCQYLDGKAREYVVELYFSLIPLWNWSDLMASLRSWSMISSLHLRQWQHMVTSPSSLDC